MLENRRDEVRLRGLTTRGIGIAYALRQHVDQHGRGETGQREQSDVPLIGQQPDGDHHGLEETAGQDLHHGHGVGFHVVERRRRRRGDIAQALLVEVAHEHALEPLAYLEPLLRAHREAAEDAAGRSEVREYYLPDDGGNHDAERCPYRRRCAGPARKSVERLHQHHKHSEQGQDLEERVQNSEQERKEQRLPLCSGECEESFDEPDHALTPHSSSRLSLWAAQRPR